MYNDYLNGLSEKNKYSEVIKLFDSEQASATSDTYKLWGTRAYWYADEAVALLLGKNPDVISYEKLAKIKNPSPAIMQYCSMLETFKRKFDTPIDTSKLSPIQNATVITLIINGRYFKLAPTSVIQFAYMMEIKTPDALLKCIINFNQNVLTNHDLNNKCSEQEAIIASQQKLIHELKSENTNIKKKLEDVWEGFDEEHLNYPKDLDIALQAWRWVSLNLKLGVTIKQQVQAFLNANYSKISKGSKEAISKIVNWDEHGTKITQHYIDELKRNISK